MPDPLSPAPPSCPERAAVVDACHFRRAWHTTRSPSVLDLLHGIDVFLNAMPGASMLAMRTGIRSIGVDASNKLGYTDPKADSAQVMVTVNTVTTYGTNYLDLNDGSLVIEAPPNALGFVDDMFSAASLS
jgi:hypothetical protein